ncbi:hypothetical protein G6N05_11970 [Flavobacterium sp. F372]|uniref:Helix-turn-helix domain-containing protein n=1 Tax=Flavobacterium bernardetii TaxID=2813823 RepID=A0ABR7IZ69_9FLAO|nr:hypothetical protein [Flavobacterium bernardetii]MBC5835057.1 hypothetical protein [Flavobacterium bernardetii]NHF70827.1 hypothetical protein [Flavobacterium bernardetii]
MKPIYTTIPVKLCEYSLVNRITTHLMTFAYLKHISSGHVRFDTSLYKVWASDMDVSERTVRNSVNWLIKNKWITVNSKKKSLRIISYLQLCKKLNLCRKLATIFEPEDFSKFQNFCCAVVFTYYLKKKEWSDKKRRSVSIMEDTSMNRNFYLKDFKTLPIRYLAKCLGVSISTANNYKKNGIQANLLTVKRQVITMTDKEGVKLSKDLISTFKYEDKNITGRLRTGKKYLKRVESDLIKTEIIFKRKVYKH